MKNYNSISYTVCFGHIKAPLNFGKYRFLVAVKGETKRFEH